MERRLSANSPTPKLSPCRAQLVTQNQKTRLLQTHAFYGLGVKGSSSFFASNLGFDVMRADTKAKVTREVFPRRYKLEQAHMNPESQTLYAVISATTGDDKAADVVIWKPNLISLERRPSADLYKTYARIMDGDISIPRDRLLRKDMQLWTPVEVVSLFSRSSVSGQRALLWNADITGKDLIDMNEQRLTQIGVYEAPVRRQILLEVKFALRDQRSSNSPANSRSASISGETDTDDASDQYAFPSGSPLRLRLSGESPRSESVVVSKANSKLPKAKVIFTVDGTNDIVSIKVPGPSCSFKQFQTALYAALLEEELVRVGAKFTIWKRNGSQARTPIVNQKQLDDFISADLSRQQLAYLEVSIEEGKSSGPAPNFRVPLVSVIGKAGSHSDLFMPTVGALLGVRDNTPPRTKHSM
eukprot:TRINITY_DN6864_c0_g1_i1.p1 TRINITY_DN6864_c0_g1~~TRINITY_DN6864_c0_g1_i1.p1  ORF type:complete len:414 (+),score=37.18 TRINITY_DN6864_c0_g1_i1:850-2091(+)